MIFLNGLIDTYLAAERAWCAGLRWYYRLRLRLYGEVTIPARHMRAFYVRGEPDEP